MWETNTWIAVYYVYVDKKTGLIEYYYTSHEWGSK